MTKKIGMIIVLVVILAVIGWGIYELLSPKLVQSGRADADGFINHANSSNVFE